MKAINTLKAVGAVSLALAGFQYAIGSQVEDFVTDGASTMQAAAPAPRSSKAMEARVPLEETIPDMPFGAPDPDFGHPSPAVGAATVSERQPIDEPGPAEAEAPAVPVG
jgi:hypothetical protein